MKELYTLEERNEIIAAIPRVIDVLGGSLDEMFWTPLRDIQVFSPKTFSSLSSAAHPMLGGLLLAGSLVSNLGYLGKVFNKNKVQSLSEVLENCREAFGDKYCYLDFDATMSDEQRDSLQAYFQEDLIQSDRGYLDVSIDNSLGDYHLRYRLSKTFTDILISEQTYVQIIEGLNLDDKKDAAIKAQLDKMIPEDDREKPITHVREKFFQKARAITASDVGKTTFDFAGDVSFQFWLVFFVSDMLYNNTDTNQWSLSSQIATLGIALGISLIKFGAKFLSFFRKRKAEDEQEAEFKKKNSEISVEDKSLQHKQYTSLFIQMMKIHNQNKANNTTLPSDIEITEAFINKVELPEKPLAKRLRNRFLSIVKSTTEIEEIILGETDNNKSSFVQKTTALQTAVNVSLMASFGEWLASVAIATASHAKSVADFFDSTKGGIIGVVCFAAGGLFGVIYYNKRVKPQLEAEKAELKKLFSENSLKFEILKELEVENKKLRKLVKANHLEKLPTMKGYDDRAFRRLVPSQKTNAGTYAKKTVNRTAVVVGRTGTGILLFRLGVVAILGMAGIALASTVAAVFWPVTVAALVIGAVWAGIFLHKYVQERRIASAKNFINDIDNRIEAEQVANDTYRQQLKLDLKSDRYNQAAHRQNLAPGYEQETEAEDLSDTESSEETNHKMITPGKKDLPLREITPLPKVMPKRLKFFDPAPRINEDLALQYNAPVFTLYK